MNGKYGGPYERKDHTMGERAKRGFQKVSVNQQWVAKDTWVSEKAATSSRNYQGSWKGRDLVNGALSEAFTASAEQRVHFI